MATFNVEKFRKLRKEKGDTDEQINKFLESKGINPTGGTQEVAEKGDVNFLDRFKLSFGGPEAREKQQRLERQAGLKGKFDVGDIADVAGGALPVLGGLIGAAGGTVAGTPVGGAAGAGIGATAGAATRRTIGQLLGVRDDVSPASEAVGPIVEGGLTFAGGKALPFLGRAAGATGQVTGRAAGGAGKFGSEIVLGGKNVRALGQAFRRPEDVKTFRTGQGATQDIVNRFNEAINKISTQSFNKFQRAANQLPGNKVSKQNTIGSIHQRIIDNLDLTGRKVTKNKLVGDAGLSDQEASQVVKVLNRINANKNWTDRGVLNLRQSIDRGRFVKPGNPDFKESNRIISAIRKQLNDIAGDASNSQQLRKALNEAHEDLTLLEKFGVTLRGSKPNLNVEATANRLETLLRAVDDPTKKQATANLLRELQKRTGLDLEDLLRSLSAGRQIGKDISEGDIIAGLRTAITRGASRLFETAGRATGQQPKSQLFTPIKEPARTPALQDTIRNRAKR